MIVTHQREILFSLLGTDDAGRQVSLAQPASGQAQLTYQTSVENDQYHERTEKDEEAVEHVLVDDVVDEIALEVGLNGGSWRQRCAPRHIR